MICGPNRHILVTCRKCFGESTCSGNVSIASIYPLCRVDFIGDFRNIPLLWGDLGWEGMLGSGVVGMDVARG